MRRRSLATNNIAPIAAPSSSRSTARSIICWRPTGSGCSVSPATGTAPDRLDAILFETFGELRAAREAEDRRIVDYVDGLDDARIAGSIRYRRVSTPEVFEQALAPALAHWFNHQTHHRGQVHALLTGLVGRAPELDLLYLPAAVGEIRRRMMRPRASFTR